LFNSFALVNGAAERAVQMIKNIRTFSQQENVGDKWDDYLHFFESAHNISTSIAYPDDQAIGRGRHQLHFRALTFFTDTCQT
jgi:hypothetical protein